MGKQEDMLARLAATGADEEDEMLWGIPGEIGNFISDPQGAVGDWLTDDVEELSPWDIVKRMEDRYGAETGQNPQDVGASYGGQDMGMPSLPPAPGQPGGQASNTGGGAGAFDFGTPQQQPQQPQQPQYGGMGSGDLINYDPANSAVAGWLGNAAGQIIRQVGSGQALKALATMLMGKAQGQQITPSCAKIMADQLTQPMREAVHQFQCGMKSPMGLSKQGQQTFLAIQLATTGLPPGSCGCG